MAPQKKWVYQMHVLLRNVHGFIGCSPLMWCKMLNAFHSAWFLLLFHLLAVHTGCTIRSTRKHVHVHTQWFFQGKLTFWDDDETKFFSFLFTVYCCRYFSFYSRCYWPLLSMKKKSEQKNSNSSQLLTWHFCFRVQW